MVYARKYTCFHVAIARKHVKLNILDRLQFPLEALEPQLSDEFYPVCHDGRDPDADILVEDADAILLGIPRHITFNPYDIHQYSVRDITRCVKQFANLIDSATSSRAHCLFFSFEGSSDVPFIRSCRLFEEMARSKFHNLCILRLCEPYGHLPRDETRHVVGLLSHWLMGREIVLPANSDMLMSAVHLRDVAAIVRRVLRARITGTYTIGLPAVMTIEEVAKLCAVKLGFQIRRSDATASGPFGVVPDCIVVGSVSLTPTTLITDGLDLFKAGLEVL